MKESALGVITGLLVVLILIVGRGHAHIHTGTIYELEHQPERRFQQWVDTLVTWRFDDEDWVVKIEYEGKRESFFVNEPTFKARYIGEWFDASGWYTRDPYDNLLPDSG